MWIWASKEKGAYAITPVYGEAGGCDNSNAYVQTRLLPKKNGYKGYNCRCNSGFGLCCAFVTERYIRSDSAVKSGDNDG